MGDYVGGYTNKLIDMDVVSTTTNIYVAFFRSFLPYMSSNELFDAVALGVLVIFVIFLFVIWKRGNRYLSPISLFFLAAFFISLIPAIGFLNTLPVIRTNDARERLIYLPSVFTLPLVLLMLRHIIANTKIFICLFLILSAACFPVISQRADHWIRQSEGSKKVTQSLKEAIHSDPDWKEPERLKNIICECYKNLPGGQNIL